MLCRIHRWLVFADSTAALAGICLSHSDAFYHSGSSPVPSALVVLLLFTYSHSFVLAVRICCCSSDYCVAATFARRFSVRGNLEGPRLLRAEWTGLGADWWPTGVRSEKSPRPRAC